MTRNELKANFVKTFNLATREGRKCLPTTKKDAVISSSVGVGVGLGSTLLLGAEVVISTKVLVGVGIGAAAFCATNYIINSIRK